MTREERLELLRQIEKDIHVCSLESTFLDDSKSCAIHSAIEELEQEHCEDCISREYMYKLGAKCIAARNENDALVAIASIESLPSVQPKTEQEPKTQFVEKSNFDIRQYNADLQNAYDCGKASQEPKQGHWIERIKRDEFDDYEEVFYKCSECGIEDCYKFAYCPNCGCRMEK